MQRKAADKKHKIYSDLIFEEEDNKKNLEDKDNFQSVQENSRKTPVQLGTMGSVIGMASYNSSMGLSGRFGNFGIASSIVPSKSIEALANSVSDKFGLQIPFHSIDLKKHNTLFVF